MKIAYALGGGGARGYAHVGVIKALHESGIMPDLIAGTSMGAVVGAMYAQTVDPEIVKTKVLNFINSEDFQDMELESFKQSRRVDSFFGNALNRPDDRIIIDLPDSQLSLFKQEKFVKALDYYLDDGNIEDTKIKLGMVAADLNSGEKVVLKSGDIKTAALASGSIPGFLPPVQYQGKTLVDGEIVELIPCMTAKKMGGDFIIATDVRQEIEKNPHIENALDVFFRANQIKSKILSDLTLKADVIIHPDIEKFHWTEFEKAEKLMEIGYQAGLLKIDQLKSKIQKKKLKSINK